MESAAGQGFTTATDLADWLVRELGLPFRRAHHVTGTLVKQAEEQDVDLDGLSLADMQAVEGGITDAVFKVLGVRNSVASRVSFGGTAPSQVRAAIAAARARL
jgi:argininosuccinate lyase